MTNLSPAAYSPSRSLPAKVTRRLTQWQAVKPLGHRPRRPIVSFTFDDFPKSAAVHGARILESHSGHGTFYACTGMAGKMNLTGLQFDEGDLESLRNAGHEIGGHSQTHVDMAVASTAKVLSDIDENIRRLSALNSAMPVRQFAYPFGETTMAVKRQLAGRFDAARGILPGANMPATDVMQLRAFELDSTERRMAAAAAAIDSLRTAPSWIVLFTHDVRETPSAFGVSPTSMERLVKRAAHVGAVLLSMSEALDEICGADA